MSITGNRNEVRLYLSRRKRLRSGTGISTSPGYKTGIIRSPRAGGGKVKYQKPKTLRARDPAIDFILYERNMYSTGNVLLDGMKNSKSSILGIQENPTF